MALKAQKQSRALQIGELLISGILDFCCQRNGQNYHTFACSFTAEDLLHYFVHSYEKKRDKAPRVLQVRDRAGKPAHKWVSCLDSGRHD